MHRKFIAILCATAIAITALGATSARAEVDDRDLARALAAILGVAVIGKIIHDKKKKDDHVVTRRQQQPLYHQPRPRQPRYVEPRRPRHVAPRPLPRRVQPGHANRHLLPPQCFRSFETRRSTYRGFGQRCLRNNYQFTRSLPRHCLVNITTRRGHSRNAYLARCLRDEGYRLARR